MRSGLRAFTATAVIALVACARPPGTDMGVNIGKAPDSPDTASGPAGKVKVNVVIDSATRQALAVTNWASIKITLSNSGLMSNSSTKTVDRNGGSTTAVGTVFTNLRPGAGYALSVSTYDGAGGTGTWLQKGASTGIDLVAGANTVTITLGATDSVSGAVTDAVPASIVIGTQALTSPTGVVADSSGNLYFGDANCRILKKRADNGTYSVLAGSGVCATSAQCTQTGTNGQTTCDGTGTSAILSTPQNMAIDSSGNIYFAETGGKCLLLNSNPGGTVETMLGNGCGYSNATSYGAKFLNPKGVVRDSAGNIYVADTGNHKIRMVSASSGQPTEEVGAANAGYADNASKGTGVAFSSPKGIAFDSTGQYLYVADSGNHVIRKVFINATGQNFGATTTLAGTAQTSGSADGLPGTGKFNSPSGLVLASDGFLYVADTGNHKIRKVHVATGEITTVAGNGTAGCEQGSGTTVALLSSPEQVFKAADGSLYIANTGCNKISVVQ